jgi:selenocysteine lyase/cysteine desulfurase
MDPDSQFGHWARQNEKSTKHFLQGVHQDLVSSPYIYNPPFGKKKSTYVDWFASGKPLKTIEHIMQESVLPYYANTHTYSTSTARYTSTSVANSRRVIGRCLNAYTTEGHPHQAAVLFCG